MSDGTAFLFDLDGTLVDSVYQHVLAWRAALEEVGIDLSVWRIHRRIGMSGGLFINALLRETETGVTRSRSTASAPSTPRPITSLRPGATAARCPPAADDPHRAGVPWAIATSGRWETAATGPRDLGVPRGAGRHPRSSPARQARPDLFQAAAERLGVNIEHPSSSATASGIYSRPAAPAPSASAPLRRLRPGRAPAAGAYRVYDDPADLLLHLDEVGVRGAA